MKLHGMIDIETCSTRQNGIITSIGAVRFNPYKKIKPIDELYIKLDIHEQSNILNRHMDLSTMIWWAKQEKSAVEESLGLDGRVPVKNGLRELQRWCKSSDCFWANGITFDFGLLENLILSQNFKIPWRYNKTFDMRTLRKLSKTPHCESDNNKNQVLHNPVDDCKYQINVVQRVFGELGITEDYEDGF